MMTHATTSGDPTVLEACTLGLTAQRCVDTIITDVAVMRLAGGKIRLEEFAADWTFDAVQAITGARLNPTPDMRETAIV